MLGCPAPRPRRNLWHDWGADTPGTDVDRQDTGVSAAGSPPSTSAATHPLLPQPLLDLRTVSVTLSPWRDCVDRQQGT